AGRAAAGPLRPQGAARPAGGDHQREHHHLPRAGADRRPAAHPAGAPLGVGPEDHQARHRTVLGDRRRVPQPARRARRRRVVHRVRLREGGPGSSRLLPQVHAGDELTPLSYDVSATTIVLGALAARDWRPMHHDHDFAVNRNGTRDIFMNTPNQAAWFERYLTDWSGPKGRLGAMTFRMKGSVFPGDTMALDGTVTD